MTALHDAVALDKAVSKAVEMVDKGKYCDGRYILKRCIFNADMQGERSSQCKNPRSQPRSPRVKWLNV